MTKYNLAEPWKTLDEWQKKVLKTKGNFVMRSGRQVGKSAIISVKCGEVAMQSKNKTIMVIAKVERQSQLLFQKILRYIHVKNKDIIMGGVDRPTKTRIKLTNGSIIYCLPAGDTGYGIMGFTIDLLIADEAAFIPEEVWNSVIPTLAVTKGDIWLLSTPFIKEGYYYNCFNDPTFTSFHQSSEDCQRRDDDFLTHKKATISKAQYAQMYLGLFVDNLKRLYSDELIKKCCILERKPKEYSRDFFLGVDCARMGEDESTFEILDGTHKERIIQIENIITTKTLTTDTERKILELEKQYDFNKIGIDDGGLGVGIFDHLLENSITKRKIVALNNASRDKDKDKKTISLLKEDMYNHLLILMEKGQIKLLNDDNIKESLRCILAEYPQEHKNKMLIWGKYSHITEGIIRACWLIKKKRLNIYVC